MDTDCKNFWREDRQWTLKSPIQMNLKNLTNPTVSCGIYTYKSFASGTIKLLNISTSWLLVNRWDMITSLSL
jgi:hypothetical protein